MAIVRFADQFWDTDFNGTTGYDNIINHMKDGKKLCDAFIDFLNKRAKLEEDYGRNLIKISSQAETNNETGTLQNSWESIKREAENVGFCHLEVSKKLNELLSKVQLFREHQKNERNKIDEKMKKIQKEKKTSFENSFKAKRNYELKCRESDQHKEAFENKATYTPKEEEKLKKNIGKAKTNVENADSMYMTCVKQLEDNRMKWILEMEDACNTFQHMETERVKFLRNEMWVYTNIGAVQAVDIDNKYEECRKVLEKCDEAHDIKLFVEEKKTGSERPAPIKYENYYHSTAQKPPQPQGSLRRAGGGGGQVPYHSGSMGREKADYQDSSYSSIAELRIESAAPQRFRKVVFEYVPQGPKELNLKVGGILEVMRIEDADWGIGKVNGAVGAFPLSFTEPC